jgi:hypothetical protein
MYQKHSLDSGNHADMIAFEWDYILRDIGYDVGTVCRICTMCIGMI